MADRQFDEVLVETVAEALANARVKHKGLTYAKDFTEFGKEWFRQQVRELLAGYIIVPKPEVGEEERDAVAKEALKP